MSPYEFFLVLFCDELIEQLVFQTNLYATQKGKTFKSVTKDKMLVFLAKNILIEIKKPHSYRDCWSSHEELRDEYISSLMSPNRFGWLLSNLHVNDNSVMPQRGSPNYDKLYKIRPLIEFLKNTFKENYAPTKNQSESIVKFKGRISYKQYMHKKPIKRGYKIWLRADKLGYVCDFRFTQAGVRIR